MAKKAPANSSLAYAVIAAGSQAAVFAAVASTLGLTVPIASLLQFGGAACIGTAGLMAAHDYISSLPAKRLKVAFENCGIYIKREAGIRLPVPRGREKLPAGWRFFYKLPIGLAKKHFDEKQEEIEAALDGEVSFAWRRGLLMVDILQGEIPAEVGFELPENMPGEIPFTVGYGREGLITADLASCPHLLVAGQTGGGKSNFLHQMIASLPEDVELYLIDLKEVEFAYLEQYACVESDLDGALRTLELLTAEMGRRKKLLKAAGCVSAKEYRQKNGREALNYKVLIVDEFSQLCPVLAKEKPDREAKNYAHKMLVDLICLARSLGIHIVIATQRPDADILPGQLKANIPATICFKVRNQINSRICLDNDRAVLLPSPADIPGRAIWQHMTEREVQVMHLPMVKARRILQQDVQAAAAQNLPTFPSPPPSSFFLTDLQPGRFVMDIEDPLFDGD